MNKLGLFLLFVGMSSALACGRGAGDDREPSEDANENLSADDGPRIEEPVHELDGPKKDGTPRTALVPLDIQKTPQADGTVLCSFGNYQLVLDKKDPTVPDALVDELLDVYFRVYETMGRRFSSSLARRVRFVLDPSYNGVAFVSGASLTVSSNYIKSHPKDVDVMTHEAFHVVQSYRDYGRDGCPSWAAEGFADYARYRYGVKNVEGGWSLPDVGPNHKPTDSYRVTARFFVWLESRVRASIMDDLNGVLRRGAYRGSFWSSETGKSLDDLWAAYRANSDIASVSAAGCVAGTTYCGGHTIFGASDILYRCEAGGVASQAERCMSGCGTVAGRDACR